MLILASPIRLEKMMPAKNSGIVSTKQLSMSCTTGGIIAIGSSGTHATDKPCLPHHPNYDQPERRPGTGTPAKAGRANRLYPLKPTPVFRTSAEPRYASMDEVSAPLTGLSKKKSGR